MHIELIETPRGNAFLWIDYRNDKKEYTAEKLYAPIHAMGETFQVFRNKVKVYGGEVSVVGTHAPCAIFRFDMTFKLPSKDIYTYRSLEQDQFEVGDVIEIKPCQCSKFKPRSSFEKTYWSLLIGLYSFVPEGESVLYKERE